MKFTRAGMAVWVVMALAAMAAVGLSMYYPQSTPLLDRSSPSMQSNMPTDAIRENGSQPMLRKPAVRISGEVIGLVHGASLDAVTVNVGGYAFPATIQGHQYSAQINGFPSGAMVVVEARSLHAHFRTVVGSVGRLAQLAGDDGHLVLSERSSLRVSPYSTALAWMVSVVLDGVSPATDAEFEEATRSAVGNDLVQAAYSLASIASGEQALPIGYENGSQLLADRAAFAAFLERPDLLAKAQAYLFEQADSAPLSSLTQLASETVMLSAIAQDDRPLRVSELSLLSRNSDGSFNLYENESGSIPKYSPSLDERGHLLLAPEGKVNFLYLQGSYRDRVSRGHTLRRLTDGESFDVWMVKSRWTQTPLGALGLVEEVDEYRLLSSFDLASQLEPEGWPALTRASRALPWICFSFIPVENLQSCDYVQYQLRANGDGNTFDHEWKVDSNGHPRVADSGQEFSWSLTDDGVLRVENDFVETRFWRIRKGRAHVGPVIYLSTTRSSTEPKVSVVGFDWMITRAFSDFSASEALGIWRYNYAEEEVVAYPSVPYQRMRAFAADGTGDSMIDLPGAYGDARKIRWQVLDNSVFYVQHRLTLGNQTRTSVPDCRTQPLAAGDQCNTDTVYFKPMIKTEDLLHYYGIIETYLQGNTATGARPIWRLESQPSYMKCIDGVCRPSEMARQG